VNSPSRCEPELDAQTHVGVWDWRRCKAVAQSGWRRSFWLEFSWSPQAGFTHQCESFKESVFFYFSPKAVLFQKKPKLVFSKKKVQFSFSLVSFSTMSEFSGRMWKTYIIWGKSYANMNFPPNGIGFFIYYGIFFTVHMLKAKCVIDENWYR
jgi:hypothetical protein